MARKAKVRSGRWAHLPVVERAPAAGQLSASKPSLTLRI
jgi:hypothetical protein